MKKIIRLSESQLTNIVKKLIKEQQEEDDKIGINLRSLLDGELNMAIDNGIDFTDYKQRNEFISKIEDRLQENDWISLSNGTTFDKSFNPSTYERK